MKCEIRGKWLQDQEPGKAREVRSIFGRYHGREVKISDIDARPGIDGALILLDIILFRPDFFTSVRDRIQRSTKFFIDGVEQKDIPSSSTLMGRSSIKVVRQWLNDL